MTTHPQNPRACGVGQRAAGVSFPPPACPLPFARYEGAVDRAPFTPPVRCDPSSAGTSPSVSFALIGGLFFFIAFMAAAGVGVLF